MMNVMPETREQIAFIISKLCAGLTPDSLNYAETVSRHRLVVKAAIADNVEDLDAKDIVVTFTDYTGIGDDTSCLITVRYNDTTHMLRIPEDRV